MPLTQGIFSRRFSKRWKVTLKESPRGSSIRLASNATPSSTPSGTGSKRKVLHKEKSDYELPAGSGEDYSLYPLVIGGYWNMGDVIGWNGFMNSHLLSQQDWDFNNDYVSGGNGFINSRTLYQCNDSSSLNGMDGDVEMVM